MQLDIPLASNFATPDMPYGEQCTENSLLMVLWHFDPTHKWTFEQVVDITGKKPNLASWELKSGIWFANNGYQVQEWALFDYEKFSTDGIDYIRAEYGDETADWQEKMSDIPLEMERTKEFVKVVDVVASKPTIEDMVNLHEEGWLVCSSVNSDILCGRDKYTGHVALVTGFMDTDIIFNDPGLPAIKNNQCTKVLFQKAMDSFGGQMVAFKKR
jgi:hypothetical protein